MGGRLSEVSYWPGSWRPSFGMSELVHVGGVILDLEEERPRPANTEDTGNAWGQRKTARLHEKISCAFQRVGGLGCVIGVIPEMVMGKTPQK